MKVLDGNDCVRLIGIGGDKNKYLTLWDVPAAIEIGVIPKRIYCSEVLIEPLANVFYDLIELYIAQDATILKTWDGCFIFRPIRGYEEKYKATQDPKYLSIHSWGIAVDINANWNQLGRTPTIDRRIVSAFKIHGFDWGGDFHRLDSMHFQLQENTIVEQLKNIKT